MKANYVVALFFILAYLKLYPCQKCTPSDLITLKACYKTYVDNFQASLGQNQTSTNLISDQITWYTGIGQTDEACQNFADLNECLGDRLIKDCMIDKNFKTGFDYTFSADFYADGQQWVAHHRILTFICSVDDEARLTASSCHDQIMQNEIDHPCNVTTTCTDLTSDLSCLKDVVKAYPTCVCPEEAKEIILKWAKVSMCSRLVNCDDCQNL